MDTGQKDAGTTGLLRDSAANTAGAAGEAAGRPCSGCGRRDLQGGLELLEGHSAVAVGVEDGDEPAEVAGTPPWRRARARHGVRCAPSAATRAAHEPSCPWSLQARQQGREI